MNTILYIWIAVSQAGSGASSITIPVNAWVQSGAYYRSAACHERLIKRSHPSDEKIMEVARKHWKLPGRDVIDFVRELLG